MGHDPASKQVTYNEINSKRTKNKEFYPGLVLAAYVGNSPCQMTIDTGSSITNIYPSVLSSSSSAQMNVKKVTNSIKTVTGEKVPLVGRSQMKITIGGRDFFHDTWIADISKEAILGLDFMKHHSCQLDIDKGVLSIDGETIELSCDEKMKHVVVL